MEPTLAMLANVEPRSRPTPAGFQLLKMEGPKGELELGIGLALLKGLRCGMDPARRRDKRAEPPAGALSIWSIVGDGDLPKGLCDGVGRADLAAARWCRLTRLFTGPPGNLDGTVPARALRVCGIPSDTESGTKPGKPSVVGDSGMFSRRGVEFPLVGGPPQGLRGILEIPS